MYTIDLISFLSNYYGIAHTKLSFETLTHDDIPKLFPFIEKCSLADVVMEKIASGDIIGVYDRYQKVVYYYNPHLKIDDFNICVIERENESEEIIIDINELEKLSKEELLSLRRKLRLNNQRKDSYIINGLIKKIKKSEPKMYRKKKEKILIKERMNYND